MTPARLDPRGILAEAIERLPQTEIPMSLGGQGPVSRTLRNAYHYLTTGTMPGARGASGRIMGLRAEQGVDEILRRHVEQLGRQSRTVFPKTSRRSHHSLCWDVIAAALRRVDDDPGPHGIAADRTLRNAQFYIENGYLPRERGACGTRGPRSMADIWQRSRGRAGAP